MYYREFDHRGLWSNSALDFTYVTQMWFNESSGITEINIWLVSKLLVGSQNAFEKYLLY